MLYIQIYLGSRLIIESVVSSVIFLENYFDFVTLESIASEVQFATLTNQLDSTLSQFQVRIMDIIKRVGPQMQEALRKAMFHVAWSPDTLPTNQAVEPLFDYLHTHFQALNLALLPQNFQKVLFEASRRFLSSSILFRYREIHAFIAPFTILGVGVHVGRVEPPNGQWNEQ